MVANVSPGIWPRFPAPAFGGALWSPKMQRLPIAPARCISRRGLVSGIGRVPPLREMTSAAYGISRDSVAEATAVGCQARFFLKLNVNREGYRGKNSKHGTPRSRGLGALMIERRHRPCGKTRAPNTSDGACRVRHSPSGRPPTNGVVAVNADTGQRSASESATESLPAP